MIYNAYASSLNDVIPESLSINGYADDHAVDKNFDPNSREAELNTIITIEICMVDVKAWMDSTRLKLNESKTEFAYFGNQKQISKCTVHGLNVNSVVVKGTHIIKYLGAWMDESLTFKTHVQKKCSAAMINFLRIRNMR